MGYVGQLHASETIQELRTCDHEIHLRYKLNPAILKLEHQAFVPKEIQFMVHDGVFGTKMSWN